MPARFAPMHGRTIEPSIAKGFGQALRKFRLTAELTQEELGFNANLQRKYISLLELGAQQPTLTTICKLAVALGIKPGVLVDLAVELADEL